jgi:hypothetical protein
MSQYGDLEKAIAGQKFGLDDETETVIAREKLYPGDPIFGLVGEEDAGYGAHLNGVTLTASAALVASNSVAVTINGISVDSVEFDTSSPKTIQKIVEAINLNAEVRALGIDAFLIEGSPLKFALAGPGITITATAVVTLGDSQATFTSAAYTTAKFLGIARHMELSYVEGTGFYPKGVNVSVMTHGKITVPVEDDAAPGNGKSAYVILTGDDAGKFTDVAEDNYDSGCLFRSSRIEGNLALIEVRGMK